MEKNIEISLLFDFYKPLLTQPQQQAVELYYNDDCSLAETADLMGITRQGVRDLVKRGEAVLYGYEEKLGLFKRFNAVEDGLEKICGCAQDIMKISDDLSVNVKAEEIFTAAQELME